MSIIKIKKHEKYTTVDNTLVNDRSLDWDELGLMLYLLSKPNNWNVSIKHLAKQKKAGETKIKRMLKTLQASGYATWSRDKTGKTAWAIYENPQVDYPLEGEKKGDPQVGNPHEANPHVGFPHVENQPDIIKTQPLIKTDVKQRTDVKQLQGGKSTPTWDAYSRAYLQRYGVAPLRSAKVNSLLCRFVDEVGADDAPLIAAYYLRLSDQWYLTKSHDIPTLVQNSQGIRTQWATGTKQTTLDHRRNERRETTKNAVDEVIQKIDEQEKT